MKKIIFILLILLIFVPAIFSQEDYYNDYYDDYYEPADDPLIESKKNSPGEDFWISLGGEAAMYSTLGMSYGGSLSLGYGKGIAMGLKTAFFINEEEIDTLEINFLLRFYLLGATYSSGPFLQVMGGPVLFNHRGYFAIPGGSGTISAGLGFGWRFVILDRWFIEPAIRGGYPYVGGGSLSAGMRF